MSALARIAYWTYLGRMQAPTADERGVERVVEYLVRLVGLLDGVGSEPHRR